MTGVRVRAPATSANLGPGFDCLALALDLYNAVELRVVESGIEVVVTGEGAGALPTDKRNLIAVAAERAFSEAGKRPGGVLISSHNRIPLGSGLGSSAAATITGLVGANALVDGGLSEAQILAIAADIEGHADNAAAALGGGLVAVRVLPDEILVRSLHVVDLTTCVIIPEVELPTAAMRAALPAQVPLATAVVNQASLVLLVEALRQGNFELLSAAAVDQLHEPYRLGRIPGALAAVRAGYQAGAAAVVLSGAGPGLLALTAADPSAVGAAMQVAFEHVGVDSRMFLLPVAPAGATVEPLE